MTKKKREGEEKQKYDGNCPSVKSFVVVLYVVRTTSRFVGGLVDPQTMHNRDQKQGLSSQIQPALDATLGWILIRASGIFFKDRIRIKTHREARRHHTC